MKLVNVCLVSLLLLAGRAWAVNPPTLADALQAMPAASLADGSVLLTTQPETVTPVSDAAPAPEALPVVPTPDSIAAQYGRMTRWQGHVLAVAPPTMTVLSTNPRLTDLPLPELASQHPIPLLLGSLTPEQLGQMAADGLAFSDLSPDQQGLLQAALPHPFQVVPKSAVEAVWTLSDTQKTGEELQAIKEQRMKTLEVYNKQRQTVSEETLYSSLRLRGFLAASFMPFAPDGSGVGVGANEFQTTGAYKLAGSDINRDDSQSGRMEAYLKAEIPNALKDGDLVWNRSELERAVSLNGLKSVDALVARLAKATGLELYADPRLGSQSLLVQGDLTEHQPAADIMQALCLCVCGAWRQVGPAFVLTDDTQGLGARQEFLRETAQAWSRRLTDAEKSVGGHLGKLDWIHTLHFADGDIRTVPAAQLNEISDDSDIQGDAGVSMSWKELPPPLQDDLRDQLLLQSDENDGKTAKKVVDSLKPDSQVTVNVGLQLAIELPGMGAMMLDAPYQAPGPDVLPGVDESASLSPPSLALTQKQRGVLWAVKTPEEAQALVARLPKLGLNTLFLDVFHNGRAYFPNKALPPVSASSFGVLQAALLAGSRRHIAVYAVLDTFCWRKDTADVSPWPAGFDEDLTIQGEAPPGMPRWANPLDTKTRALLPALVKALAQTKGLAGIVFQDTAPPGYLSRWIRDSANSEGAERGYAPENRLAYLRLHHLDPIDLSIGEDSLDMFFSSDGNMASYNVSVQTFPSNHADFDAWNTYRGNADKSVLAECWKAAQETAPRLPLLMRERKSGDTLDPWLNPKTLNQRDDSHPGIDGLADYLFHPISPRSILIIPYGPHSDSFATLAAASSEGHGAQAAGILFDLATDGSSESLTNALDRLGALLKKPN